MSCGKGYCFCRGCRTQEPATKCRNRGLNCADCGERAHRSSEAARAKAAAKKKRRVDALAEHYAEMERIQELTDAEARERVKLFASKL